MTEQTSSTLQRDSATDSGLPTAFRARLDDLGDLPAGSPAGLRDLSASETPAYIDFAPPTAITRQTSGDSLYFRRTGGASPRITRFVIEQEFEEMVVSVDPTGDAFIARLADRTGEEPEEEVEIAFEEISPDDRSLIVPGALFSWSIGRVTETSGQVRRISELRFRRFFRFTPSAIAKAEENAEKMLELLNEGNAG